MKLVSGAFMVMGMQLAYGCSTNAGKHDRQMQYNESYDPWQDSSGRQETLFRRVRPSVIDTASKRILYLIQDS